MPIRLSHAVLDVTELLFPFNASHIVRFVPPGFCVVRRHKSGGDGKKDPGGNSPPRSKKRGGGASSSSSKGASVASSTGGGGGTIPANLNFGTAGERVYLCYRRSREGNPLTAILPLVPSAQESVPEGYTVLERTPRNYVADINHGAGPALFLAFRQRLANLEPLRPLPLVLAVYYSNLQLDSKAGDAAAAAGRFAKLSRATTRRSDTAHQRDVDVFFAVVRYDPNDALACCRAGCLQHATAWHTYDANPFHSALANTFDRAHKRWCSQGEENKSWQEHANWHRRDRSGQPARQLRHHTQRTRLCKVLPVERAR